jgi:hypothetical protein
VDVGNGVSEARLDGGATVGLTDGRLVVTAEDGTIARSIPLTHIAGVTESDLVPDVYLRLFTQEELVLSGASFKDAERIGALARNAPRLQRREQHQRRELRGAARHHVIFGGLACLLGFAVTAASYSVTDPGGWYLVMLGPIVFGLCDFTYGLGLYFTRP